MSDACEVDGAGGVEGFLGCADWRPGAQECVFVACPGGMMRHMPAIPESTRSSIIVRLLDHAETNWPQLVKVRARYHGSFAYITGVLRDGEQIPLCRLRYGGSAHSFGFAIYSAARARYEDALLRTGSPIGTPQEALDTACTVHVAGPGHEPPTN